MLKVTSEIGRLRQVLVHEPGPEVDQMVPAMMEELLFDDILYGERAREEHGSFRRVLQVCGIETVEARDLLEETLENEEAREWALRVILESLSWSARELAGSAAAAALASILVAGLRRKDGGAGLEADDLFHVPPLPNWCFQRDPQVVFDEGVIFSAMASPARHREALLARLVFRFHPRFSGTTVLHDPLEPASDSPLFLGQHRPRFEGGDMLVLSRDVVAVGRSERTNLTGIRSLMRTLCRKDGAPRWLLVVEIPRRRAYMHLDTLLTPIDRDACLVFSPVILSSGSERARVLEVDLHERDPAPRECGPLLGALAARGLDLEPVPCGGGDPVDQTREQWTDGANTLALAPGVITLYDRNVRTLEELGRRGFRLVEAEALLLGRDEVSLDGEGRCCIVLSSHEMSRARGGPHCLSHPLLRDEVS